MPEVTLSEHSPEHADLTLDATGLRCPLPLLKTRQALRQLAPGALLLVRATDIGARRDIPAYLRQSGHELVRASETDGELRFLIRVADTTSAP
ncbi:sulfurtransferase TusA family protein [Alcanivorax quisquiliarum]|uniref:Sulfurtransferase TusA family protein n=1 Tax=Alcanivorax quisquiliarum TaxID=2933565 RepID=A0ABT0E9L3_9GAMM|nr:sulfurtransferase TusA family protein [Alcanivorax quisquiliarum]MCK0538442.1 sulfurtransferase TusA family protein [Alcanivorax quisquiliarum]